MAAERVHADDTTVPVLEPGLGKTRAGRLWCYVRDDRPFAGQAPPAALYRYSPDRKGEHPRTHLGLFRGILQADGYQGYARLYDRGVTEAACMAHARRKFVDVYKSDKSPLANEALQRIAALYAIEATIRGRSAAAKLAVCAEQSAPLFADLKGWMEQTLRRVSGKSDLAGAIRYALSRWDALSLVLRDGRVCLDNNAAERAMRPIPLGRKNWLFAGSDEGATYCPSGYVPIIPAYSGVDFQVAAVDSGAAVQRPGGQPGKRGLPGARSMARSGRSVVPLWSRCQSAGELLSGSASGPQLLRLAWPLRVPPVRLPDRAGFVSGGGASIRSRATNRFLGR
jgi:hypothetical protein